MKKLKVFAILLLPFIFCNPRSYNNQPPTGEYKRNNVAQPDVPAQLYTNEKTDEYDYSEESEENDEEQGQPSGNAINVNDTDDVNVPEVPPDKNRQKQVGGSTGVDIAEDNYWPTEKETGSGEEEVHDADDINKNPDERLGVDVVNAEAEQRAGGVLKDISKSGTHVHQGDIMFRECEEEEIFGTGGNLPNPKCKEVLLKSKRKAHQRDATTLQGRVWGLPVSYQIDPLLNKAARDAIQEAKEEYDVKTCITFQNQVGTDYISFFAGTGLEKGCWSYVGRYGGKQKVSLSPGCESKNTAIHEIMHALGFWHEQTRTDRDNFVTINWDKISPKNKTSNFVQKLQDVTTYGFGYDYRSTMHYSKTAFGKKYKNWLGQTYRHETITPKIKTELGQCSSCGLSRTDALQLNARYCNDPKKTITLSVLIKELKRWMAIYEGQINDEFRHTLLNHFEEIYPEYYLTVSSYYAVQGYDTHAFTGYCGHVWRQYGRNVVVCYSKKTGQYPTASRMDEITNAVVTATKQTGCNAKNSRDLAIAKAETYNYEITAVHIVRFGNNLRSTWNSRYTRFENFRCGGPNDKSSLVIMYGNQKNVGKRKE